MKSNENNINLDQINNNNTLSMKIKRMVKGVLMIWKSVIWIYIMNYKLNIMIY